MFLPLLGFGSRAEPVRPVSGKRAFPEGGTEGRERFFGCIRRQFICRPVPTKGVDGLGVMQAGKLSARRGP